MNPTALFPKTLISVNVNAWGFSSSPSSYNNIPNSPCGFFEGVFPTHLSFPHQLLVISFTQELLFLHFFFFSFPFSVLGLGCPLNLELGN